MKKTSYLRNSILILLLLAMVLSTVTLLASCQDGEDGKDGADGTNGLSAYEIAVQNGFKGNEEDWLASLKGTDGSSPTTVDSMRNINEALLASVSIYCEHKRESVSGYSAGSGVIYELDRNKGDAYVITNYHVVYNNSATTEDKISDNIRVYLYGMYFDGTERMNETGIAAEYIGGSMTYDIAVLKISGSEKLRNSDARAVKIANSNEISAGITAIAIGNPEGIGISFTSGVVSIESEYISMLAVDNTTTINMRVVRIDTAVNEGNSGGGLFNSKGELIGIVNAKLKQTGVDNIGYAIPSNVAVYAAQNIIDNCDGKDNKMLLKCLIGITVLTTDTHAEYNEAEGTITLYDTVTVQEVTETSIAKGVIKAGDVLQKLKLGDREEVTVCRQFDLIDLLLNARVGDTVVLTVLRNGEEVVFTGTFTEDNVSPTP